MSVPELFLAVFIFERLAKTIRSTSRVVENDLWSLFYRTTGRIIPKLAEYE
jgi:hypothetical protein